MKQLTVYFSIDLESRVVEALEEAGCSGYFRLDGMGTRFLEPEKVPRTISWEAACVIVPQIDDRGADQAVGKLQQLIHSCDVEPCIRITVSAVERVI